MVSIRYNSTTKEWELWVDGRLVYSNSNKSLVNSKAAMFI
jgi:hypothetical protein